MWTVYSYFCMCSPCFYIFLCLFWHILGIFWPNISAYFWHILYTVLVRAYIWNFFVYLCIRKWKLHVKSIFSAYFLHIPDGPIPASPVPCCSSSIPQQALVVVPQQASINSSLPINSFGSWFGRSLKQSDCLAGTCYGQQLRTGHARARASPPSARPARNAKVVMVDIGRLLLQDNKYIIFF